MRLLITGASGFVGSRLWDLAEADGHDVVGVGRRALERPGYRRVDLGADAPDLPWHPDAVVHAAARSVPYARHRDYVHDNVDATRTVLALCARLGHPRLVYVSTSAVLYRDGDQLGLTEDAPVGPTFANDYARTKAAGEVLVRGHAGSWAIARPRAVFGPGDPVLFPRILTAARAGRLPLLTGRATPAVGDLVYVDNLARQLLTLATRPELTGVYHLTNAEPVELQALLLDVLDRLAIPRPTRRVPIRRALRAAALIERTWRVGRLPGEPPITRFGVGALAWSKTFDPARLLADLGRPAITVAEGVERFVAWQRERG